VKTRLPQANLFHQPITKPEFSHHFLPADRTSALRRTEQNASR
jgi:hypothetical protein